MAAGGTVCQYSPMDTSQENAEFHCGEGAALHERLVAYVHALHHGARRGVWGEHSYARGAGEPPPPAAGGPRRAWTLLEPRRQDAGGGPLDVDGPADVMPPLPGDPPPVVPDAADEEAADAEDWEARVLALAPSDTHARLARSVCAALRRMQLERLVSGGGGGGAGAGDEARALAASMRRALAPLWAARGAGGGAPAWLQAALTACMPCGPRRLYAEALDALRDAVPRLAERLTGAWGGGGGGGGGAPPRAWGPALGPDAGPWLVWVSSGRAALDARWERRLGALMHTRVLRAPPGGAEGALAPEAWCAGAAGAVRAQLTDALAEAGERPIILGGVGCGAALCVVLARGAGGAGRAAGGVRGAVLVAPPLRTAERARSGSPRDDALRAVRLPLLLVVGERAACAPHHQANLLAECGGGGGARRLVCVRGADAALRLPRRTRRRLRLPQHALDAALTEECVRWALDTAEGEEAAPPSPSPAPPSPPPPRRHPLPTIVHRIDLDSPDEEYAHLPTSAPPSAPLTAPHTGPLTAQNARSIEIVEGRVVSRAPPAPAPRPPRAPPRASSRAPLPVDIMQMPIVFADEPPAPAPAADSSSSGSPVTVTSGKARGSAHGGGGGGGTVALTPSVSMTRVIVAKRGGSGGAWQAAPPAPSPATARGAPVRVRGGARRLLVRRGMRVLAPPARPPRPPRPHDASYD